MKAVRGFFCDTLKDPFAHSDEDSLRFIEDGLLVYNDEEIVDFGSYTDLKDSYQSISITDYRDYLILPGFTDLHVHYPQTEIIGSYGEKLLNWLNNYVYPVEQKFKDFEYSCQVASFFLDELLRNGTTTALVFATTHSASVDALFMEAEKRNMQIISGKTLMNRNAPEYLLDNPVSAYDESRQLINKWHGKKRLRYAVTPRFAITCTRDELDVAGRLYREFNDIYIHSHISENIDEINFTMELFPECTDYLNVYEASGLINEKTILAHGIHLSESELIRIHEKGASVVFCPTSNLFLGSGLLDIDRIKETPRPVKLGAGTDVGGGTSLSMIQTLSEGYKVSQLNSQKLSPVKCFYLMTKGGADALSLEKTGNFNIGNHPDFNIMDCNATKLMEFRNRFNQGTEQTFESISEKLFSLITMGDDRAVYKTYCMGKPVV